MSSDKWDLSCNISGVIRERFFSSMLDSNCVNIEKEGEGAFSVSS